ncbi:unnamed protein product [Pleuronectes platessa]|uniref:Uncharacterized protein n=1 Tax=Pleuronectes platessa TaxID=8262 RepID=A0A9N7ZEH9_PLEPL|nr:unnamed protein product [Pleuronectes platessa]
MRGSRGSMGGHDLRGQGLAFGVAAPGIAGSSAITAVQQQEYSAGIWLRRKDKLEHVVEADELSFNMWSLEIDLVFAVKVLRSIFDISF